MIVMKNFKHISLFMKNNGKHLWRKWYTLPLLLLFPIILFASLIFILTAYFSPDEEHTIQVGLVDLDQSEETQLVVQLIEDSSQLGSFIQLETMTESKAMRAIKSNQISAYITFPDNFTNNLYQGSSVELPLTGNPKKATESHVIKELLDSVTRHIRYSQANILTINDYMRQMPMDDATRQDILFEEFKHFFFYTVGKDKIINEKDVENQATSQTKQYYGVALWFIITTIWLFVVFQFLIKEESHRMVQRMKLYGVTQLQQHIARIIVTLMMSGFFSFLFFIVINKLLNWELYIEDYGRIFLLSILYSCLYLVLLACLQTVITDRKFSLLIQSVFTIGTLFLSGAIIPVIYFPLKWQDYLPYVYTTDTFHWFIEIIVNDRFYADYWPLLIMNGMGIMLLLGLSAWKERVQV